MGKISQTKDEEKKEKILQFLRKEPKNWFTSNQISKELGIHFYKAENLLNQLNKENKVEMDDSKGFVTYWRIKQ